MKEFLLLLLHRPTTVGRLLGRGGAKALVAENLLIKQQLLIRNREIIPIAISTIAPDATG